MQYTIYKRKRSDGPKTGYRPYTVEFVNPLTGKTQKRSLRTTRKQLAYARFQRDVKPELEQLDEVAAGLAPRSILQRSKDLPSILAEYLDYLIGKNSKPKSVRDQKQRLTDALEYLGCRTILGLQRDGHSKGSKFLAGLLRKGKSPRTRDHYRDALVAFGNWLVETERLETNPFGKLKRIATEADKTKNRVGLTENEVESLCAASKVRGVANYCATHRKRPEMVLRDLRARGEERSRLFFFLAYTGIRKGAAKALRWGDVDLDADRPTVRLSAKSAKNKKTTILPLLPEVVEMLREQRNFQIKQSGKVPTAKTAIFRFPANLLEQIRKDAIYAGICDESFKTDDGLDLDIHALRHSYCSILARRGVPLLTAQKLMTHSQPHLTANIYNQSSADDLGATLDQYFGPASKRNLA